MKAIIKVVSAGKFTPDQEQIIKRIANVLREHDLSISIERKIKKVQTIKLKAV
jgi:protein-tyrosine-phosphatase